MEELNCNVCTIKCHREGCGMRLRTPEENRDYQRVRKYQKILVEYQSHREPCAYCDKLTETLHHIDENRGNNRKGNLLPLCLSCHEELKHKIADNPLFYSEVCQKHRDGARLGKFRPQMPLKTLTPGWQGVSKERKLRVSNFVYTYWRKSGSPLEIQTDSIISKGGTENFRRLGYSI